MAPADTGRSLDHDAGGGQLWLAEAELHQRKTAGCARTGGNRSGKGLALCGASGTATGEVHGDPGAIGGGRSYRIPGRRLQRTGLAGAALLPERTVGDQAVW